MASSAATRVKFAPVEGAAPLFTPVFLDYLVDLHDRFTPRIGELLARRAEALTRAHTRSVLPSNPPTSAATTGDWHVPPVPTDLQKPGIEISGPCSITSMFINALNPGPEGERAEGDLDDDEDSGGHRLVDSVRAAHNRVAAVQRELHHFDAERKREYRVADGELPFFMHRERGLHLVEPEVTVDGTPVNAALLGTALTLFHAGRAQAERNQGIYFYLPKLEFAPEARLYRDVFDRSRERLPWLRPATIRAIVLVESLPCVYEMDEMLYELGAYAAGLNAARWDLKASIFEYVMADPKSVWPDRFGVDIKTTPFLSNIFRRLVAISLKRGAVPIGGMATALPNPDPDVNRAAGDAIRADKESRRQSRGRRRDPGRQGVGSAPGLHPRLGRPHLSHEDGRGSLQAAHRLGVETDRGNGPARELSDRDRRAGRADHARRHAPELSDGDRVRRGLAERPRRQGHRQPRGQAGHPSRAHGGSRHRPHVGRPDRAADPPPRAHDRRSRRGPRFRAGEAAAR